MQMIQHSATRCSCIAIFVSQSRKSFAAITLCVASRRVFIVIVYFVYDSVRKLLDTTSYDVNYTSFASHLQQFTNSVYQSLSWNADSRSRSQETPRLLWKPKVHYRVHRGSSIGPYPEPCESRKLSPKILTRNVTVIT